ncbi:MAG: PLP-dependent transferase, partial [Thermoguttaceae bacterium]
DVGESIDQAKAFVGALEHVVHAVSLGATETLVCLPYLTTMLYLPEERRTTFGVRQNTIRLSAGIEKPDLLIEDLRQALNKV